MNVSQLSSIREKVTWKTLVVIGLYLAAALLFVGFYLPAKGRIERLETQLEQVTQREAMLAQVVEQRSGLQAQLQESEANLQVYSRQIPSQYDLAEVLEALEAIGARYDVQVEVLDHAPVKTSPETEAGVITLALGLEGGEHLFSYLSHVQEVLPSLRITQLGLGYLGSDRFVMELGAALQVFVLEQSPGTELALPEVSEVATKGLRAEAFGRPFGVIGQFLGQNLQVLGIVQTANENSALLLNGGVRTWIRPGERLGEALVTDISSNAVSLEVDGVYLKLAIGG